MKQKPVLFYLLLLLVVSCGKGDDPDPNDPDGPPLVVDLFDLSLTTIHFTAEKDASLVVVKTESDWKASCTANWIELSAYEGNKSTGFIIGASANRRFSREANISILSEGQSRDVKVIQAGVPSVQFEINGVSFSLLPVKTDTSFYLDGETYLAARNVFLDSYFLSETEITNAQWKAIMGSLPYEGENTMPDRPVLVNWNTITEDFIPKINEMTGYQFRLPTENEWEVAARGGKEDDNTSYAGSIYMDEVAWHYGNSEGRKHEVAHKNPNELGLYDMSGNVSEWCSDWFEEWTEDHHPPAEANNPTGPASGTEKVIRGGDFLADRFEYDRNSGRVVSRNHLPPDINTEDFLYDGYYHFTGFRLVLTKD